MVSVLAAVLAFAALRFGAAVRDSRSRPSEGGMENALLSSALEDAITNLKAQERATAARAEASERLSEQIVSSLTSGLIVVGRDNRVQIVNPAARRILSLTGVVEGTDYREMLREAPALADVIAETLEKKGAGPAPHGDD